MWVAQSFPQKPPPVPNLGTILACTPINIWGEKRGDLEFSDKCEIISDGIKVED